MGCSSSHSAPMAPAAETVDETVDEMAELQTFALMKDGGFGSNIFFGYIHTAFYGGQFLAEF